MTQLATQDNGALSLIRDALKSDVSPEKLAALLAVKRDWESDEARKAFNFAVAEFQRRAPIVAKADKAHNKEYARMDRIWREIRSLVTELGLSVTWQICELHGDGKLCHVEGQLRHRDGHGERLVMDIPLPEIVSGQNKAQQMGSAQSYAKRYALCGALGVVTGDDTRLARSLSRTSRQTRLPSWSTRRAVWPTLTRRRFGNGSASSRSRRRIFRATASVTLYPASSGRLEVRSEGQFKG
jgi:hypothetical protein